MICFETFLHNCAGEEFTRKVVSQVDLTPSIASFFDFEIPENRYLGILYELLLKYLWF